MTGCGTEPIDSGGIRFTMLDSNGDGWAVEWRPQSDGTMDLVVGQPDGTTTSCVIDPTSGNLLPAVSR